MNMPTLSIDPRTTIKRLMIAMPEHGPALHCLGINSTRDGHRTFAEFCELRGLEARTAARVLAAMGEAKHQTPAVCVELMTLAELCDHLENAQGDLCDELKRLDQLTKAMADEQAEQLPELRAIRNGFVVFQRWFKAHLRKESEYLFP